MATKTYLVTESGDQTITGEKTFDENSTILAKGTVNFEKATIVKAPDITSTSDGSCVVNKNYIDSLNANDTTY